MSVERQILVTWVNLGFYWYRCRACLFVFNPGSSLNESLNEVVIEKASEFVKKKKKCNKKHAAFNLEQWFSNCVPPEHRHP